MKRITTVLLITILLISSTTVYGMTEDEVLEALYNNNYLSGEINHTMTFEPTEPLPSFMDPDGLLTTMLSEAKFDYVIKYDMNEEHTKLQMQIDMMLDVGYYNIYGMKMWIDFDFSDDEAYVNRVIIKESDDELYQVLDYSELMPEVGIQEQMILSYEELLSIAEELNHKILEIQAFEPKAMDEKFIISIDEATLKLIAKEILLTMGDYFEEKIGTAFDELEAESSIYRDSVYNSLNNNESLGDYREEIEGFFETIEDVQLFEEEAIVISYEFDDKDQIKSQEISININTNMAELLGLFETEIPGITEENSQLKLALNFYTQYTNLNVPMDIEFPVLTSENSVDIYPENQSELKQMTVLINGEYRDFDIKPVRLNGTLYMPLRAFINQVEDHDEHLKYNQGKLTVETEDKTVEFAIDTKTITVNGEESTMASPVIIMNGNTMVPMELLQKIYTFEYQTVSDGDLEFLYIEIQ